MNEFKCKSDDDITDDEIVISGISGMFPSCKNIKEFENNLYNKVNMVDDEETRWRHVYPNTPRFIGKIPDIKHFDGTFFGVHQIQVDYMDPQNRLLIEETFKAIMDAGVNPFSLRGTNTGVYVGSCITESEHYFYYAKENNNGFPITGCSKAMFANRISYLLGLTGPSVCCDTACSSSMYALDLAYNALLSGKIDNAIVGGANICLHPFIARQFYLLGVLSPNGQCSPFDADANGYNRSEAVCCIFLQRKKNAKRVYASLVNSLTNCDGYKPEGITFPSASMQEKLLKEIYHQNGIDMNDMGYLEAHSTGTFVGDPEECKAIDKAICSKRSGPLLIGSVKSNCGHAEPASGMCSIAKVIIAMQNGLIPPNINFRNLKFDIEALRHSRLVVVTEPTKLTKPYVGVNSFGFGGANAHVLLKQYGKEKRLDNTSKSLPRLVLWSSRTQENVFSFLNDLETRPLDKEYFALVQSVQEGGIQGMVYRGYSILQPNENNENPCVLEKKVIHHAGLKRPLVWIFSGMGSQWVGMGKSLMSIPLFQQSIQKSNAILKLHGLDLINIITTEDSKVFENILHSFVGIAAIQIAIVDVLRTLKIVPDFILGHSLGELGCAYADGCLTSEQMILAAYYRGKVSLESEKIKGSMAAVGLGYKQIKPFLTSNIEVACHNSANSSTISGPYENVNAFIEMLKSKQIFAREVPCSNIAYHSKYISHLGPEFRKKLNTLIPIPKLRSEKWISSSVPKDEWLKDKCLYSSAEYHTNNLLNSVLFEEAMENVPSNSITIEISPHFLLQSILKSSLPDGVHIGLTKRAAENNTLIFLNALGSLYNNGVEIAVDKLYPEVHWPVSRGTPTLSHLIEFDQSRDNLTFIHSDISAGNGVESFIIDEKFQWLFGHEIDGRALVPATFYLDCVWQTYANLKDVAPYTTLSVQFENVKFERATNLFANKKLVIDVTIQRGSGKFEVTEGRSLIASGIIQDLEEKSMIPLYSEESEAIATINKNDFYKELKLRGYHYKDLFKSVEMSSINGSRGKIKWNNWVTFMDCMLQLFLLGYDSRSLMLPTQLQLIKIDSNQHKTFLKTQDILDVYVDKALHTITAGGIQIADLRAKPVQRRKAPGVLVLEKYCFISHFHAKPMPENDIAKCLVQLALENQQQSILHFVEIISKTGNKPLIKYIINSIEHLPIVVGKYTLVCDESKVVNDDLTEVNRLSPKDNLSNIGANIVITDTLLNTQLNEANSVFHNLLTESDFILFETNQIFKINEFVLPKEFALIASFSSAIRNFVILKKTNKEKNEEIKESKMEVLEVNSSDIEFVWVSKLQQLVKTSSNVLIVSQGEKFSGILGLVNCLRREPETRNIRCVFICDENAPQFDINLPLFANQLELGLAVNIYKNDNWGTYRHLTLSEEHAKMARDYHVFGNIQQIGDLSSLKWFEGPLAKCLHDILIVYSSLNFKDVMQASGRLPITDITNSRLNQTCIFGFEYSGVNKSDGKRIMGMTHQGAVSSYLYKPPALYWEVPHNWSLRDAATVPVVYLTVYYAFFYTADIRKGKSILIHAGSGGIGLAAIRVALAYGLEVFTTVSTEEKKKYLLKTFPTLNEKYVGNSRSTSFEYLVKKHTKGEGVDFVLNSLSEDKLKASVRCLKRRGHFLEIGKFDMANNNDLGLGVFLNELSFHGIFADNLLYAETSFVEAIKLHINQDLQKGIIQPLPSTVFTADEMEQGFRYLMSGKHIGKVLIQMRENSESESTFPITVLPQTYFSAQLSYVVPGGLGGFGLELIDWMILRGARKIVINSRQGISNDYQKLRIDLWRSYSCKILINTSDISTQDGCSQLLTEASNLGSLGGIFNLAVILKDGVFANQTTKSFQDSFKPKAMATKYLDELSRKLYPNLQHFVIFSSVSCGRGNAGQTNYGMANSIMERIIEDRVEHGFAGKAVQWGAVGEVGLVAELAAGNVDLEIGGTVQQRISSCIEVLDKLLAAPEAIVASMIVAEKREVSENMSPIDFILKTLIIKDIRSVSVGSTLTELGMDSLMGVEIQQGLERNFDISLNIADLRTLTFAKLQEMVKKNRLKSSNMQEYSKNDYLDVIPLLYGNIHDLTMNLDTFDKVNDLSTGVPLIIFPGIEGKSSKIWKVIGNQLKLPTIVLQFHDSDADSLDDFVNFAYNNITQLLKEKSTKKFQIVGYSYGALIAFSTISLLENNGYNGKAVFIDGSPLFVETFISALGRNNDDVEKQTVVTVLSMIFPEISRKTILDDLKKTNSELSWVNYVQAILKKRNFKNINYLISTMKHIMCKIKIAKNLQTFKGPGFIKSKLLLIKPTILSVNNIDIHYGLSGLTRSSLEIEILEGNHQTILENSKLTNIVNKFFS